MRVSPSLLIPLPTEWGLLGCVCMLNRGWGLLWQSGADEGKMVDALRDRLANLTAVVVCVGRGLAVCDWEAAELSNDVSEVPLPTCGENLTFAVLNGAEDWLDVAALVCCAAL
jgi:hypothetical protein